jgi:tetratricopeptide (TPR) repeat protein
VRDTCAAAVVSAVILFGGFNHGAAQTPEFEQLSSQGPALMRQGRHTEAEAVFKTALQVARESARDHRSASVALNNLGLACGKLGKAADAMAYFELALSELEKAGARNDDEIASELHNLAVAELQAGTPARAERSLRRALALPGLAEKQRPALEAALASSLFRQGQHGEAGALFRRLLSESDEGKDLDPMLAAAILHDLGVVCTSSGHLAEGAGYFSRALALQEKARGENHPILLAGLRNLAYTYAVLHRTAEAEVLLRRAIAIAETAFGRDPAIRGKLLADYAAVLKQLKRKAEARQALRDAEAILAKAGETDFSRYTVDAADLMRKTH